VIRSEKGDRLVTKFADMLSEDSLKALRGEGAKAPVLQRRTPKASKKAVPKPMLAVAHGIERDARPHVLFEAEWMWKNYIDAAGNCAYSCSLVLQAVEEVMDLFADGYEPARQTFVRFRLEAGNRYGKSAFAPEMLQRARTIGLISKKSKKRQGK
jgi:hypothetical protein